nr:CDP-glycerol glycerophosphotransferase family protein [Acinetobacter sp. YH16038]
MSFKTFVKWYIYIELLLFQRLKSLKLLKSKVFVIDKLFKKIIYFFSGFIRRNQKKWVFASHTNFGDNARYLFLDSHNPQKIRKIWIAKNKKEYNLVTSLGYECYLKGSFKAKLHALTAKNFIYTCYVSDIGYQYSRKANCINLWHGIPLKKIEFDIHQGPLAKKFNHTLKSRIKHPEIYRGHDYVLCPSKYVYEYSFKSAFHMQKKQILNFPYPRSIFLKSMSKTSKKIEFLYAPTWRDNQKNFIQKDILDFNLINQFCAEHNCIFKIKFHPNTKVDIDTTLFKYIVLVDSKDDPNQCLAEANFLITDYSSIFFDYLVFDRPILFYVFDESEYKSKSREIYSEAEDINCGHKIYNQQELLNIMSKLIEGQDFYQIKRKITIDQFGLELTDVNNKRLYQYLSEL